MVWAGRGEPGKIKRLFVAVDVAYTKFVILQYASSKAKVGPKLVL